MKCIKKSIIVYLFPLADEIQTRNPFEWFKHTLYHIDERGGGGQGMSVILSMFKSESILPLQITLM